MFNKLSNAALQNEGLAFKFNWIEKPERSSWLGDHVTVSFCQLFSGHRQLAPRKFDCILTLAAQLQLTEGQQLTESNAGKKFFQ